MELGELVAVSAPLQDDEPECPFDHSEPEDNKVKNELGGIGTTLGKNVSKGVGINMDSEGPLAECIEKKDPREEGKRSVFVKVHGEELCINTRKRGRDGTFLTSPLPYPLTCAAHHLIPAQESLKGHNILTYMCADGETQDFRKSGGAAPASVSSKVWGNVGYNVNGGQNAIWLPGNYAVGAGTAGAELWKSPRKFRRTKKTDEEANRSWVKSLDLSPDTWDPTDDPEEEENPQSPLEEVLAEADMRKLMLSGKNYNIADSNPKWGYVDAAMDKINGHFHDRHEPYSKFVKDCLEKLVDPYDRMYDRSMGDDEENCCEKCKKSAEDRNGKIGPPRGIIPRLNSISQFLKPHISKYSAPNIYTSKWVLAKMKALKGE